jgi:hypothetical protein
MSLQSINRARLFSELVTLHINTERPDWGFALSCETLFAVVIMSSDGGDSDVESTAPAYDQQEIITQLTDFYQFLSTLPYIDCHEGQFLGVGQKRRGYQSAQASTVYRFVWTPICYRAGHLPHRLSRRGIPARGHEREYREMHAARRC